MNKDQPEDTTFLSGFNQFWDTDFPKVCPACSRTYSNYSEFLERTAPSDMAQSAVEYEKEDHSKNVGIFRNCPCGSTLMILRNDRRDTSEAGEKRRQIFGAMLDKLLAAQVPREEARARLLKVLYSGQLGDLAKRLLGSSEQR